MHPLDIRQLCEDCNLSDPLSERSSFFETSSFLSKSTRYLGECRVKKISANFVGELMQIFNSSAHALFDIFHDCFFQPPSFQPPVQFIYSFGYKVISIISCLWDIKIIEAKSEVNTKPHNHLEHSSLTRISLLEREPVDYSRVIKKIKKSVSEASINIVASYTYLHLDRKMIYRV